MAVSVLDGEAVRAELAPLGMTDSDLARFVHVTKADLSRALQGRPLSPETLYRIALGIDILKRQRGLR
jgi:plasmid maintenance system antidote protein VapI